MSATAELTQTEPAALSLRIGIMSAGFCSMLNLYAPQAILPMLASEFGVGPAAIGLTITATTLAVALSGPFSGAVADAAGRRRVLIWALVLLSVPTVWSGLSNSLPELLASRFAQGLLLPAAFAATLGYISTMVDRREVASITALYVAANVSGGFAGRFLGGAAADLADWHWAFYILAAINLTGALLVARLLRSDGAGSGAFRPAMVFVHVGRHLRNPPLLATFIVGFNLLFALVTVFSYINFHLSAPPFDLSPMALGLVFCVYLIGVVVTPRAGRVIGRIGQRRALLLGCAVAVCGLLLTLLPHLIAIVAGLALFCSAVFACQTAATSQIGAIAGESRSSAAGLYLSFYYAGGGLGAFLPGLVWVRAGWWGCILLAVAAISAAALVAALSFNRGSAASAAAGSIPVTGRPNSRHPRIGELQD